jgi:hypothetical protein
MQKHIVHECKRQLPNIYITHPFTRGESLEPLAANRTNRLAVIGFLKTTNC